MHESDHVARHLLIQGLVQGVAFRASARTEADRLGLCGWVRNRSDGCVEAVVAGSAGAVEHFVRWAHRGPSHARVDSVAVNPTERPEQTGFRMLPTL
ncbi:acylphosphatase [Aromatoleum evansii]|uniref:Acylphosphatase n=1 Tax=Aromatoleum evansii TaxID=59406 RepID=A0ABZ1APK1_AROEV|nr:acylphosphatase [Aromatoleum evansii]NMG31070.1 acylphosphatase [Aromatoleum evansii]WRL47792.1 acylphosphatase [Aromatoleum evansii]